MSSLNQIQALTIKSVSINDNFGQRMKTKTALLLISIVLISLCHAEGICRQQPVKVIFDSDMGPDYDDVGALAMLHALTDKGEAEILGTIASTKYEGVAKIFDIINTHFGRPDLPVGVPKGDALLLKDFQHWTDTLISRYPCSIKSNEEAVDAVTLYRTILAAAGSQCNNCHGWIFDEPVGLTSIAARQAHSDERNGTRGKESPEAREHGWCISCRTGI